MLALLTLLASAAALHGNCGHQCTQDSECAGCGSNGACRCPDAGTPFTAISCSCVNAPPDAPAQPPVDVGDSVWPTQWSAKVTSFVYLDFSNKTALAQGQFYYDGVGGHSRADWKPYINGKDATQVWIADLKTGKSNYYVKSGPVCISFPIRVPGTNVPVGVEKPDWMSHCAAAGSAIYVGREQVTVDERAVWTDHWSCHINDISADQAITFQNWHSLGLEPSLPKGLPLRVTGGNSAPNGQKGSPRLSTVWYSNFTVGASSSKPSDFEKPARVCIPVALDAAEAHYGREIDVSHVFDAAFHTVAHALLERVHSGTQTTTGEGTSPSATPDGVTAKDGGDEVDDVSNFDLRRARTPLPRPAYQGVDFAQMNSVLNAALTRMPAVSVTKACFEFSSEELRTLLSEHLLGAASPSLLAVYDAASHDGRRRVEPRGAEEFNSHWGTIDEHAKSSSTAAPGTLQEMHRDSLCHKAVLWFVHHLTSSSQREVGRKVTLPLLPLHQHTAPPTGNSDLHHMAVYSEYTNSTSCQACHFAR